MKVYKISDKNLIETSFESSIEDNKEKYWIIINPEELQKNNKLFKFNHQTIFDCMHNEDTPKIEIYKDYDFGIVNIIGYKQNYFKVSELDFYITKKYLIFVCKNDLKMFKEIEDDVITKGTLSISFEKILYNLIDKLTINDFKVLSNLEIEISNVEEDVIQGKTKDYVSDILSLKNRLLFLKKHYEPLLDIVEDLTENQNHLLDENSIAYFTILLNRIERLNRKVGNLRDYITQVRESYQSQLDINLNNIMRLFTVITLIFSPLTLIVGWYGMNFVHMPELKWAYGYMFVTILCISVVIICIIFFKKKKLM
ncbi:magnesium transporter [Sedimentibacter acidaminivorans]|uniref:Magnesium transporter n=1 Tax=Sedimentibacter acidaminivorans TaxID=913099 RepID=A0ABS4GB83_9FIRM|nr:CorA family divalent cation transporter [Sedimentibacter acidaminivorans]MBP1924949.1 magnesium transporter [Sedimentibacter acidaminivorans]